MRQWPQIQTLLWCKLNNFSSRTIDWMCRAQTRSACRYYDARLSCLFPRGCPTAKLPHHHGSCRTTFRRKSPMKRPRAIIGLAYFRQKFVSGPRLLTNRASECPLLGVKRKSISGGWMSACSHKRKFVMSANGASYRKVGVSNTRWQKSPCPAICSGKSRA